MTEMATHLLRSVIRNVTRSNIGAFCWLTRYRTKRCQIQNSYPSRMGTFSLGQLARSLSTSPVCGARNEKLPCNSLDVLSTSTSEDGQFLNVSWHDGTVTRYPYIWIRDNCRCSQCFNSQVNSRLFTFNSLDLDTVIKLTECRADGNIAIYGTDGHESIVHPSWLDQNFVTEPDPVFEQMYWGSGMLSSIPRFHYDDVLNDDNALYEWMKCTKVYGLALIRDAPKKDKELQKLGGRIAHLRKTFYGSIVNIKSKEDTYFLGYTTKQFPLHTDYTFGASVPGIVMFHGIERPLSGGENFFVDGFKLAKDLEKLDPTAYKLLCTGIMHYALKGFDYGKHFDHRSEAPIIRTNWQGDVVQISYSDHARTATLTNVQSEDTVAYYKAMKQFSTLAYSPENIERIVLGEGDIITAHNYRVLHGRAEFVIKDGRGRHIQLAYFDIEDFESRFRVLCQNLKYSN